MISQCVWPFVIRHVEPDEMCYISSSQTVKDSRLKIDALLERSRCRGVGERQQWIRHDTSNGPIGERVPQPLIDNQQHTIIREGSAVPQQQLGAGFGTEQQRTRRTSLFLGKQYWPHISNTRRALFSRKANSSCTEPSARIIFWLVMRNTFQ